MTENEISRVIYESAIEAHRTLGGPGLSENIYEEALAWEVEQRDLRVDRHVAVPIVYKGQRLASDFVKCKATSQYHPIFESQLLTFLRLTGLKLGMVINFGEVLVKDGIHRVVNGL